MSGLELQADVRSLLPHCLPNKPSPHPSPPSPLFHPQAVGDLSVEAVKLGPAPALEGPELSEGPGGGGTRRLGLPLRIGEKVHKGRAPEKAVEPRWGVRARHDEEPAFPAARVPVAAATAAADHVGSNSR